MKNILMSPVGFVLLAVASVSSPVINRASAQSVGCFIVNSGVGCYSGTVSCYASEADNAAAYGVAVADLCKKINSLESDKGILAFSQTSLQAQVAQLQKEKLSLQTNLNVVDESLDDFPAIKRKYKAAAAISQALSGDYAPVLNLITNLAKALNTANAKIKRLGGR